MNLLQQIEDDFDRVRESNRRASVIAEPGPKPEKPDHHCVYDYNNVDYRNYTVHCKFCGKAKQV